MIDFIGPICSEHVPELPFGVGRFYGNIATIRSTSNFFLVTVVTNVL